MTKIAIKNFQSIKKIDFDIDGFTVIVGKNNIGKSAIIRSIEYALTNEPGENFIRTGEKSTEVDICRKGLEIKWKKGDTATYEINKQTYSKLNRSVPQALINAGFEQMEIGNKKTFPLIASQFDPLFLIDEPGSTVTEVLASLYNINTLSTADDLCQKELKSKKSLLKLRNFDQIELRTKIEKYKDFDIIKDLINIVTEKNKLYDSLNLEIQELISFEDKIAVCSNNLQKLKDIKKTIIPDIKKCRENLNELIWIKDKEINYSNSLTLLNKLKSVKDINIPTTKNCSDLVLNLKWLTEKIDSYYGVIFIVNNIKSIKNIKIPVISELNNKIKELEFISICIKKISEISDILKKRAIIDLSIFEDKKLKLDSFIKDLNRVKVIDEEYQKIGKSAKSTRDELRVVIADIEIKNKEKAEIKVCPLCGGTLK